MKLDFLNSKSPWNILVIDDSKFNRTIIKKNLDQLNMNVDEATDGIHGLKALKNKKYDLVLVDLIMPKLDGFGFLEKFNSLEESDFIPVILMTGTDDLKSNIKIKSLRTGADDFLLKPLNERELVARVISLLRLKNTNAKLYEKNQQIAKELETAKKIQEFIIPRDHSNIDYPSISSYYLPIEEIGGDFFDIYKLEDGKIAFLIADVTGHGIPAALIMTMSKMLFNIYFSQYTSTRDLMIKVNNEIKNMLLPHQYITAFYSIFDPETSKLYFTNAGHVKPLFYKAKTSKIFTLDTNGLFLGISNKTFYEIKSITVNTGDRLFLFTDGVTELRGSEDDEFGENRLASFMVKNKNLKGKKFCNKLLERLKAFTSLEKNSDDVAFMNIEF